MDVSRGTWTDAGISNTCTADVTKLVHKKEYLFRVRAVNNIGESNGTTFAFTPYPTILDLCMVYIFRFGH